ncbi:vacuolar protein sorting-associated protein 26B-like [Tropilaelaps mercedesae]|uniref:Vacuolar protein sorting-associated protein 26B-like n=1 Tax=Tropilaelaps mercedesae TaxID=418985 RepID=A0A1V9XTA4_9ACAR|nr:vacuolar protein sorting-associated protein 26B-like [Tropilaelaps mercedesae]
MAFLGFGQSADIDIVLDGTQTRPLAEIKTEDGKKEKHFLYYDGESVSGKVNVSLRKAGSRLEHQGVKIELIGLIELYYDRGNHHEFTSISKELARPGDLIQNTSFPFEFHNVEKPYESYTGANVRLRYFLRVTIVRRLTDTIKELELAVHTLSSYPDINSSIKMEVGIEDCLHIEFEYNKSKYHLKDVIVGKIYFLLEIILWRKGEKVRKPVMAVRQSPTVERPSLPSSTPASRQSPPVDEEGDIGTESGDNGQIPFNPDQDVNPLPLPNPIQPKENKDMASNGSKDDQ